MRNSFRLNFAMVLLFVAVLASHSIWAAEDDDDLEDSSRCEEFLNNKPPKYKFSKLNVLETFDFGTEVGKQKSLAPLFSDSILKKKNLPSSEEVKKFILKNITRGISDPEEFDLKNGKGAASKIPYEFWEALQDPEYLFGFDGVFSDLHEVLQVVRNSHPKMYEALEATIQKQAFLFFRHRMRPPTLEELGESLKFEDLNLLDAIITRPKFWDEALFSDIGRHIDYSRKRLKTAYARTVRGTDTPSVHRTRKIHPTMRRLTEVLVLTKSNEHYQWRAYTGDYGRFQLYDANGMAVPEQFDAMMDMFTEQIEAMVGLKKFKQPPEDRNKRWVFDIPVLFPGGLEELHEAARGEYQPTFTSFEDKVKFPKAYAEHVRDLITNADGFLISTLIPGLKIDWDLLDGMVAMSKKRGVPLILIPADGSLQDLDDKVTNHPDIQILTASIENKELLLALYPSNMRSNPLGPFEKPGMFKIGQQIIIPHHILDHKNIPTAHNSVNQTQLYTTGTINLPQIASVGKNQKAKAFKVSKEMKNSFLVVDKIDKGEDGEFGGVKNHWHVRPVEYRAELEKKGYAGFFDNSETYLIPKSGQGSERVEIVRSQVHEIVLPDVHFITANPRVMSALKKYIEYLVSKEIRVTLVFPDPIDSKSINAHVEKKQQDRNALNRLYTTGELSFENEINDAIANVNVLLNEFPMVDVIFQYSNHSDEWIDRDLMNGPTWLQLVANGPLIDEMRVACRMNGWTPLEYLLLHRQEFLKRVSVDGSDRYKYGATFVADPSRVRTAKRGEPISSGMDEEWRVFTQHHGHQGANGGKSSFATHMVGEMRSITADAHRTGYQGRGNNFWVGVGSTAWEQPYTRGGYSSWGIAMGVISSLNTMQMVQLDPYSNSFIQRKDIGPLPPEDFFGDDPLKVVEAMDDDETRQEIDHEEFMKWLEIQAGLYEEGKIRRTN